MRADKQSWEVHQVFQNVLEKKKPPRKTLLKKCLVLVRDKTVQGAPNGVHLPGYEARFNSTTEIKIKYCSY